MTDTNLDLHLSQYDLVVLLRRYDTSTHPWGVHVLDINLDYLNGTDGFNRPVNSRAIGLFTTDDLVLMTEVNGLQVVNHPLGASQVELLGDQILQRYIWSQVVPMEWHGQRDDLQHRVRICNTVGQPTASARLTAWATRWTELNSISI